MRLHPLGHWLSRFVFYAVAFAGLTFGATAGASGGLPKLLADGPHFSATWQVRPAHIVYTGDGSGVLGGFDGTGSAHPGRLIWSSWTTTRAQGSGAVWLDDCTPDCADGKFTPHAVKVNAFRPINGHFTRLTLTYTYNHKRYADKRGIIRNAGTWMYYIVGHLP
jgi:hypothetical protein